jgi:hypothetical protein
MSYSSNTFSGGQDKKVRLNAIDPPKELHITGTGVTVSDNPSQGRYDILITGFSTATTPLAKGTATKSGNSSTKVFTIPHSMITPPVFAVVIPTSIDALGSFVTTFDATNITITYQVPPPATSANNLTYEWFAMDVNGGGGNSPSSGEANTASNAGVDGIGLVLTKVGQNLPFKAINVGSTKLSVTDDTVDNTVDLDVVEANLNIANQGGSIGNSRITDLAYSKLTSVPTTIVQTNQANTFAANDQIIPSGNFKLSNSGFTSQLLAGVLSSSVVITLPNFTTTLIATSDSRLSDARTPTAHKTTHQTGGTDSIPLDTLAATTDITTLNASSTAHGLLPKLSNASTQYLNGIGTWTTPPVPLTESKGTSTQQGDGSTKVFTIAHGLTGTPTWYSAQASSTDALGSFIISVNSTNITITYPFAPPNGTNNLSWVWRSSL